MLKGFRYTQLLRWSSVQQWYCVKCANRARQQCALNFASDARLTEEWECQSSLSPICEAAACRHMSVVAYVSSRGISLRAQHRVRSGPHHGEVYIRLRYYQLSEPEDVAMRKPWHESRVIVPANFVCRSSEASPALWYFAHSLASCAWLLFHASCPSLGNGWTGLGGEVCCAGESFNCTVWCHAVSRDCVKGNRSCLF